MRGGGPGKGLQPYSCTVPPSVTCTVEEAGGCHYPPGLCGVRGAAAGDGAKPALGVGVNRGGQGTCFGEPPSCGIGEPLLDSPRPPPPRGAADPGPWAASSHYLTGPPSASGPPPSGPGPRPPWLPTPNTGGSCFQKPHTLATPGRGQEPCLRPGNPARGNAQQRGPGSCGFTVF